MGQHLKSGFLGVLLTTMAWIGVDRLPSPTTDTQVGLQYADHSHDPHVILGVREYGSQYTYMLRLQLVNQGETYPISADVSRVQMSDGDWEYWRRFDTDPWKPVGNPRNVRAGVEKH